MLVISNGSRLIYIKTFIHKHVLNSIISLVEYCFLY